MIRSIPERDDASFRLEPSGFPSPAADYAETGISLDRSLIEHPEATFFFRAAGIALAEEGIFDGDLLVVDRSVVPAANHVVVAVADGEFVLRRLRDLANAGVGDCAVWGVVRWSIHALCPSR